jgi:hypothetical protein
MRWFRKIYSYLLVSLILVLSTSCDAMLTMSYAVKNKSKNNIGLYIPNYPSEGNFDKFSKRRDTLIWLLPNEEIIVGRNSKIDFPWATKNIYRNQPGICGIEVIKPELIEIIGYTKKEWKYRNGVSILRIKK